MAVDNALVVSVGLDVSRDKIDVFCRKTNGTNETQVVANTTRGMKRLVVFLKKQETAATVPCIMESTGDYHLLAACMVTKAGFMVKVINPLITKKYQRSSIRNAKTDTIDAARLAEIGLLEKQLPVFIVDKEHIALKKRIAALAKLETMIQQLNGHLIAVKRTEQTLGISVPLPGAHKALAAMRKEVKRLHHEIAATAPVSARHVASAMRGISMERTAVVVTLLSGKTFTDRDQVVAFAGLDVASRQSGQWQGREKISKRGNAYLRKVLFQMAWGLKQHNPVYRAYYLQLRARGKHYLTCLIAITRKFLRYLFAVCLKKQDILSATSI